MGGGEPNKFWLRYEYRKSDSVAGSLISFLVFMNRLGETRMGGTPSRVRQILERIEAAIADTSKDLQAYIKAHAEFMEIGNRMLQQWEEGVAISLNAA